MSRPIWSVLAVLGLSASVGSATAAWNWSEPLPVNSVHGEKIFPHLESANRQGLAVSDGAVAVVWEDNRDGAPQCYLATKVRDAKAFSRELRLSDGECYEPVVAALPGGRFVAAWEEAGRVRARVMPGGPVVTFGSAESAQVTLASGGGALYAAWAEQAGRYKRIVVARLVAKPKGVLEVGAAQPIETAAPIDEQGWPALAIAGDGSVTVVWEDRRNRHTVPMLSHSADGRTFAAPVRLTDQKSGSADGLGAGTGAMRPTLAAWGKQGLVAVWLDKRDFLSGYDVYAAFDDGSRRFGPNLKVQDSFGDNMVQWHAKAVSDPTGRLVAIWDDARDGTPDVWLSRWDGTAFGDNVVVPAASGPGEQTDPVAAFDARGRLHLAWITREAGQGARIRYVRGEYRP